MIGRLALYSFGHFVNNNDDDDDDDDNDNDNI